MIADAPTVRSKSDAPNVLYANPNLGGQIYLTDRVSHKPHTE